MALAIAGGIYIAAHLPQRPGLGPAIGLLAGSVVLLAGAVGTIARLRAFAWGRFRQVAGWALAAYVVIAGMLGYVFVDDGARGSLLVLIVLTLLVFAVDVPLLLGFSVARHQTPGPAAGG